jgi:P-type Cu+ transporter
VLYVFAATERQKFYMRLLPPNDKSSTRACCQRTARAVPGVPEMLQYQLHVSETTCSSCTQNINIALTHTLPDEFQPKIQSFEIGPIQNSAVTVTFISDAPFDEATKAALIATIQDFGFTATPIESAASPAEKSAAAAAAAATAGAATTPTATSTAHATVEPDPVNPPATAPAAPQQAPSPIQWIKWLRLILPLLTAACLFVLLTFIVTSGVGLFLGVGLAATTFGVMIFSGWDFFKKAFHELRLKQPKMNTLIAIGTSVAWVSSLLVVLGLLANPITLALTMPLIILTIVNIGPLIKNRIHNKIAREIELLESRFNQYKKAKQTIFYKLSPGITLDKIEWNDQFLEQSTQRLQALTSIKKGDIIFIRPGDPIPVDGELMGEGDYAIDAASVFGEVNTQYAQKRAHDEIYAGSIFVATPGGPPFLCFRANCDGGQSQLDAADTRLNDAERHPGTISSSGLVAKPRVIPTFFLVIFGVALLSAAIWFVLNIFIFAIPLTAAAVISVKVFAAVFISACPCALVFGKDTPQNFFRAVALKAGVFIRQLRAMQAATKIDTLVFDKTGTLTQAEIQEFKLLTTDYSQALLLQLAYLLEERFCAPDETHPDGRNHPIARAMIAFCRQSQYADAKSEADDIEIVDLALSEQGRGFSATVSINGQQKQCAIGNRYMFGAATVLPEMEFQDGESPIYLTLDGNVVGVFTLSEQVKSEVGRVLPVLAQQYQIHILTGGPQIAADKIAGQIGTNYFKSIQCDKTPSEKQEFILGLQTQGRRVFYLGDNINDEQAILAAIIGASIGHSKPAIIKRSAVAFIRDNFLNVGRFFSGARLTRGNVRQNKTMVLLWIALCVLMAVASPFLSTAIPFIVPLLAATAMLLPYTLVAINALTLKRRLAILFSDNPGKPSLWASPLMSPILQGALLSTALLGGSVIYMCGKGMALSTSLICFTSMGFSCACCFTLFFGYAGLALVGLGLLGMLVYYKTPVGEQLQAHFKVNKTLGVSEKGVDGAGSFGDITRRCGGVDREAGSDDVHHAQEYKTTKTQERAGREGSSAAALPQSQSQVEVETRLALA